MPDRIIRDELLRSHRYVTLSSDTSRLLFIHLLLSADSLGNTEATTTALGIIMGRPVDAETAAKWLAELADVDLIRVYENGGKRYVHIPRFRQRLRYLTGKHPRPPNNIECSELKHLLSKVGLQSDRGQTPVGLQSAEVKRSEVKRSEVEENLKSTPTPRKRSAAPVLPDWLPQEQWHAWIESRTQRRNAPTNFALSLALAKLEDLKDRGQHPAAVLAQSAFHGWAGLFPVKEDQK